MATVYTTYCFIGNLIDFLCKCKLQKTFVSIDEELLEFWAVFPISKLNHFQEFFTQAQ